MKGGRRYRSLLRFKSRHPLVRIPKWLRLVAVLATIVVFAALVPVLLPLAKASAPDPCDTCVAWAWGANYSGQLGDGTTTTASTPVRVSGLTDVAQVAAGEGHTLALRRDGTVWAWGINNLGQLGNGTTTTSLVPIQVNGLTGVTTIAAGYDDSLAIRSDGTLWTWGGNFHGQLGNGSFTNQPTTTPVQVSGLANVTAIAADDGYSGASTVAVRSDGTVWAWGYYTFGDHINVLSPIQVTGLSGITGVTTNSGHTLALSGDGTVWAWGTNDLNQLGDGTLNTAPAPVKVNGLTGVTSVSTGHANSLALRGDGTVWEWGWQYTSAQGPTGAIVVSSPNPVRVTDLPDVAAISEGQMHSLALGSDGTVWAWGDNFYRQLGNGTNVGSSTPLLVNGLSGMTAVSAGYTDSLAVHGAPPSSSTTTTTTEPSTTTTTLTPTTTTVPPEPGYRCGDLKFFGLRGSGEQAWDGEGMGFTVDSVKNIMAGLLPPGTDLRFQAVDYPAVKIDPLINPNFSDDYANSEFAGTQALLADIKEFITNCPTTYAIIGGYSQGAQAATDAYRDLTPEQRKHVGGMVFFGHPMFNPKDSLVDEGDFSKKLAGVWVYVGADPYVPPKGTGVHVRSWCTKGDPVCNFSLVNASPCNGLTSPLCPHMLYINRGWTFEAAHWAVEHWRRLKPLG